MDHRHSGGQEGGNNEHHEAPGANHEHQEAHTARMEFSHETPKEESATPMPKKPSSTIFIAAIIVILAIILANAIRTTDTEEPSNDLSVEVMDSKVVDTEVTETGSVQGAFMQPGDFEDRERAEGIINRTQGKEPNVQGGERIVYGVMEDKDEAGAYYFATTTIDSDENFIGVYKYMLDGGRWQRLTKATYVAEDGRPPSTLHVVGKDGNKLLVLQDEKTRNPDPCETALLLGETNGFTLWSLDLENPLEGLQIYTLSKDIRAAEAEKQAACEA